MELVLNPAKHFYVLKDKGGRIRLFFYADETSLFWRGFFI
jgi:hypothetical protein